MQGAARLQSDLLSRAYAEKSSQTYGTAENGYFAFLEKYPEWEQGSEASVAAWILHSIDNEPWKKNTLLTYYSGIKHFFHVVLNQPLDESPGSLMFLAKRAITRLGDDSEPIEPIKVQALEGIIAVLKGPLSGKCLSALKGAFAQA